MSPGGQWGRGGVALSLPDGLCFGPASPSNLSSSRFPGFHYLALVNEGRCPSPVVAIVIYELIYYSRIWGVGEGRLVGIKMVVSMYSLCLVPSG